MSRRKPAPRPTISQLLAGTRSAAHPEPGFFKLRLVKRGAWVPARIACCDHEPDNPENLLDTGPYLVAWVGERAIDPLTVWERGQRIDEAEWRWRMDRWAWALAHHPEAPEATPYERVDLRRKPSLF